PLGHPPDTAERAAPAKGMGPPLHPGRGQSLADLGVGRLLLERVQGHVDPPLGQAHDVGHYLGTPDPFGHRVDGEIGEWREVHLWGQPATRTLTEAVALTLAAL